MKRKSRLLLRAGFFAGTQNNRKNVKAYPIVIGCGNSQASFSRTNSAGNIQFDWNSIYNGKRFAEEKWRTDSNRRAQVHEIRIPKNKLVDNF